jgi:predicted small lipoprotein YifL
MTRQSFLRWLLLALVAWPLAACGKKGKLEAPDDADPAASDVILPRIRQGH